MGLTASTGPIQIKPGERGGLIVLFPYNTHERVAKIMTCLPPRSAGRGRQAVAGAAGITRRSAGGDG